MEKAKYLIELEKYLYKYTIAGNNNIVDFLKNEEEETISRLSTDKKIALFNELVYNTSLLDEGLATEFAIIYQFSNRLKKLPLKRLANILITDIIKEIGDEPIISESIDMYLANEQIANSSFYDDGITFKYDLVERMIGNTYEENYFRKQKIIDDLFFAYPYLEEDRRLIRNKESANILAKRLEMMDFVSDIEKDNILIGFVLDTIIGNLEKGIDIGKSKNFEIASKIYFESISEPIPDELLEETVETFSYNAYEYNDTPYYKEVVKVFSKKLTHNINE